MLISYFVAYCFVAAVNEAIQYHVTKEANDFVSF